MPASWSMSSGSASTTGPGPAGDRGGIGAGDIFGDARRVVDPRGPFGDRAEERREIDFLEPLAVAHRAVDVADEQDHRLRILERDVDADAGVGRAGAAGDEAHARAGPVIAPSAQAMNAAPPSWRQVTVWIAALSRSASSTGRKLSPGTVKMRSQPCSTRQSTSRRAAVRGHGRRDSRAARRGQSRPICPVCGQRAPEPRFQMVTIGLTRHAYATLPGPHRRSRPAPVPGLAAAALARGSRTSGRTARALARARCGTTCAASRRPTAPASSAVTAFIV